MKQEVRVTLTLEVDASLSKEEIKQHFLEMEKIYTENVLISKSLAIDVKEEAEIYGNT
jgi:ribosomal protein S24E